MFVGAFVMLAASAYYYWRSPAVATELTVQQPQRFLESLPVGNSDVIFRVTNRTSDVARIVGLQRG